MKRSFRDVARGWHGIGWAGRLFDVRVLFLLARALVLGCGLPTLALPGLGPPSAEWRRMLAMLRAAPAAPGLGLGRAALRKMMSDPQLNRVFLSKLTERIERHAFLYGSEIVVMTIALLRHCGVDWRSHTPSCAYGVSTRCYTGGRAGFFFDCP